MPSMEPGVTPETVKHGIEELWSADKPEVDIVAVPGLGAHPKNCWASSGHTPFNWITDKDGLMKDFKHGNSDNAMTSARLLLYHCKTAWQGKYKVKAELYDVAHTLLVALRADRQERKVERRPILFIGHSMGGLIIAKAISIAFSKQAEFPCMFTAITGALFFGTPFGGTTVATYASLADRAILHRFNISVRSSLLEFMKPESSGLKELKDDFLDKAKHSSVGANMHLVCFFEQNVMDLERMSSKYFFGFPIIPNIVSTEMVKKESAVLDGYQRIPLDKNHTTMVTFSGWKDPEYQMVHNTVLVAARTATRLAKTRFLTVRGFDQSECNKVMVKLEGSVSPQKMYQDLQKDVRLSDPSWILNEEECVSWLDVGPQSPATSCLWVQGTEGRGKTSAVVSIIDHLKQLRDECEKGDSPPLYAYFLCGSYHETLSIEELLKSLLHQLIQQQPTLFEYAKQFAQKVSTNLTVENLWFSLTNMLGDTLVDKVYIIVHNFHDFPESSDWAKLLDRLKDELCCRSNTDAGQRRSKVRWLFTTREKRSIPESIEHALLGSGSPTREMDLNNGKYGQQIDAQLRKHADQRVNTLSEEKRYNEAFAYFARSLMGTRAEDTIWIDIIYLRLQQIPPDTKDSKLRRELEKIPKNLDQLLDSIWSMILDSNDEDTDDIRELLRVLLLIKDSVTPDELAILAGFAVGEVKKALYKCNLLLKVEDGKVVFVLETRVKEHLKRRSKKLLQIGKDDEMQWQHGVLAWRCYIYLAETFRPTMEESRARQEETNRSSEDGSPETAQVAAPPCTNESDTTTPGKQEDTTRDEVPTPDHSDSEETHDTDNISDKEDDASTAPSSLGDDNRYNQDVAKLLHYPIKNWLYHAGKATQEFADRISREDDFWSRDSLSRKKWLRAYVAIGNDFNLNLLESENFTGLHTAASLGYAGLVRALIDNGHKEAINERDGMKNTPLHLAALWGRIDVIDVLLKENASVDDGIEDEFDTPLAMAAGNGQVEAMEKLLKAGASVKAMSDDWGPIINCAIASGNKDAVKLLVEKKAELSVSKLPKKQLDENFIASFAPLSLAAFLSDLSMFNFILDQYHTVLSTEDYVAAFKDASRAGNTPVMDKLVSLPGFKAEVHDFQPDLDIAVEREEWGSIRFLVENEMSRPGPSFDDALIAIVKEVDENLDPLETIWTNVGSRLRKEKVNDALYIATDMEKKATVHLLLTKFRANANATGKDYGDALTAAAHDGRLDIVNMLIRHGARVDAPAGWALQIAAGRGHLKVVRRLLERGAKVNREVEKPRFPPRTALQAACEGGYDDVVKLLLEHEADPNKGGGLLRYPIVAAARFGHAKILTMLIQAGAEVNVRGGSSNESPLIFAAASLFVSSAVELITAGADVNYADDDGDTPLTTAAMVGDTNLVRALLKRGANIPHFSKRGVNALQYAMIRQNHDCAEVLGDWISLQLLSLQKASDTSDEATVQEALKTPDCFAELREEMVGKQRAASDFLGAYETTDFLAETDDEHPKAEVEHQDSDTENQLPDQDEQDEGPCCGVNIVGDADDVPNTEDHDGSEHDRDANPRGVGGSSDHGEDDDYTMVQATARMRISDDQPRGMQPDYHNAHSGGRSRPHDWHVEHGEDVHMPDDNSVRADNHDDDDDNTGAEEDVEEGDQGEEEQEYQEGQIGQNEDDEDEEEGEDEDGGEAGYRYQ